MKRYAKWSLTMGVTGVLIAVAVAAGESKMKAITDTAALTCSLSDPVKIERRAELRAKFLPAVTTTEELSDGYAFEFAGKDAQLVLDFVAFERDCCSFFSFVIEIEPKSGPVRLTVTGPEGAKEFLDAAFANKLKTDTKEKTSKPALEKSFLDKCCEALGI